MKNKITIAFLVYGLAAGLLSYWWQQRSDAIFIFNIPGVVIGDEAYKFFIGAIGNPMSAQAHYTIPWILRIPQIYVLTSVMFWGIVGLAIQAIFKSAKRR